jgi:hypothetical protein
MCMPDTTNATVKVQVDLSTNELADKVREHIEIAVAQALASDDTMRNYVTKALTRNYVDEKRSTDTQKFMKDGKEWLREVIDGAIREAAVAEVNRQVKEIQPIVELKIKKNLNHRIDIIAEQLVAKLTVTR